MFEECAKHGSTRCPNAHRLFLHNIPPSRWDNAFYQGEATSSATLQKTLLFAVSPFDCKFLVK